ncbi:MAG: TetR/AcrR family transcriptional regulator [Betaproteobacteria bacterium]|nr:TetR/AcrR family transcriptional regulator [Betaproteobacteria bacterium]
MRTRSSASQRLSRARLRKDEKHARARAVILKAAARLFFVRGYAGTTVDAIAEKLRMTKPFVYHYFEDKADIYSTLCADAATATLSCFDFAKDNRDPVAVLREGFRRLAVANMEHFEASSLYYREPQALAAPARRQILKNARHFYLHLRSLIEKGKRVGQLAEVNSKLAALSIAGVIGFMYRWYDPQGALSREEMADELAIIMLRIAGARPASAPKRASSSPRARHV